MEYFIQWDKTTRKFSYELDQIALLRTSEYANIFGSPMKEMGNNKVEGLIKISYLNKTIYRQYVGNNIFLEDNNSIILNYRSLAELGIDPENINENLYQVTVKPAKSFAYMWHNSVAFIRKPFQWAIYGLLLTLGLGIISIILDIISLTCL